MMEKRYSFYIGIDVAKATLDVAISGAQKVLQFENTELGLKEMLKILPFHAKSLVIMEASGGYEKFPADWLRQRNFKVAIVNAKRVRDFAKASGKLAKTDKIDGQIIMNYGETFEPLCQPMQSELQETLSYLSKRRNQLIKLLTMEKQHLESMQDKGIKKKIVKHIKQLEKQLAEVEEKQRELIQTDAKLQENIQKLEKIKGVGKVTAMTVILELPELGKVTHKEVAALAGVAPFNKDSGNKQGKREIWGGRALLRSSLYMAILSAVKYNPPIRDFYRHLLAKGKPKKVAMVACMRKLIITMNAMIKNKTEWMPILN
jgi:transposase